MQEEHETMGIDVNFDNIQIEPQNDLKIPRQTFNFKFNPKNPTDDEKKRSKNDLLDEANEKLSKIEQNGIDGISKIKKKAINHKPINSDFKEESVISSRKLLSISYDDDDDNNDWDEGSSYSNKLITSIAEKIRKNVATSEGNKLNGNDKFTTERGHISTKIIDHEPLPSNHNNHKHI